MMVAIKSIFLILLLMMSHGNHRRLQIRTWLFFCSCWFPRLKKVIEKILIMQMKLKRCAWVCSCCSTQQKEKILFCIQKGSSDSAKRSLRYLRNEWSLYISFTVSQLFVRPPQTTILPFCISFSWRWSWSLSPVQWHESWSLVLQALCLSDLIPWIYLSFHCIIIRDLI